MDDRRDHNRPMDVDEQHTPSEPTHHASPAHPPSRPPSPTAGMRRARVDDDDDNGDNSHPSTSRERNRPRTEPSTPSPSPSQVPPRPRMQQQRTTMQFMLSLPERQPFAQFSIVFDAPPVPVPNNPQQPHPNNPRPQEQQFVFDTGPISRERLASFLTNLASGFGAGIMALPQEREPDPKRAETILKALEVLPKGLVQRMNAVGGVLGIDSQPSSGEQCPVCWEPLLEDGSFAFEIAPSAPITLPQPDEGGSNDNSRKASVIALPCRHVFHGTCLLPWLSRQTTCPSCRFNLDPEQLTYKPMPFFPFQPRPTPAQAVPSEPAQTNAQPQREGDTRPQIDPTAGGPSMPNMEGDVFPPFGSAIFGGIPMVFAADGSSQEPPPQGPSSAIPGQGDPAPGSGGASTTGIPMNNFPTELPPELRNILTTMFGTVNHPQSGQRTEQGEAFSRSNPPNSSFTGRQPEETAIPTNSSPTQPSQPSNAAQTGEPSATSATNPQPPSGLMADILSAIFGGRLRQNPNPNPTTAPHNSNHEDVHPHLEQVSNPPSASPPHHRPAPGPPPPLGIALAPLPFQVPFLPFSNGQANVPPAPGIFNIARPLAMLPFPPNFTPRGNGASRPYGPPLPPGFNGAPELPGAHTNPPNGSAEGQTLRPEPSAPLMFPRFPSQGMPATQPRPRKRWHLPEGRGPSVRQRVEEKERQLGFRCFDPSCGFGPTDESPETTSSEKEQIVIHKEGASCERVCEHVFHTGCLVSAARVAGFGPSPLNEDDVEVPCSVCRTHGYLGRSTWEEGVRQLQIQVD